MAALDTVVVGGGAAGLAAAYELHRQGVGFLLLEAADRQGGVIRTDRVDGFVLDAGPDSLLAQKPAAIDLCRELGLGDRLVGTLEPRHAYVLRDRLHRLPGGSVLGIPTAALPWITTGLLSPLAKLRLGLDLLLPRGPARDESVGAFFRRRLGQAAVDNVAEPLLAGIHAGDVDRLSMRSLFPRLVEAEQTHRSLILAMRRARAAAPPSPHGPFRSLPGGLEELVTTLVGTLPAASLRCGARVVSLSGPSPYRLRTADGDEVTAGAVVLATPAHAAARILAAVDAPLARLCGEIRYTSTATVLLAYPASAVQRPVSGSGFVVPRLQRDIPLMAGSWVTSKWPGRAPAGRVLLRGFLGGARDPDALARGDDELVSQAHATFARLLEIDRPPVMRRVYRWPRSMAQHEVGHLDRLARIERRLAALPGLFVTGAGFRASGVPDCVADGRAVARAVAAWHRGQPDATPAGAG